MALIVPTEQLAVEYWLSEQANTASMSVLGGGGGRGGGEGGGGGGFTHVYLQRWMANRYAQSRSGPHLAGLP